MLQTETDLFEQYYARLNDEQKQAVDTLDGPVMVIAGPGTGKTQILAMRIANILRNPDLQMDPQNILCLTFTESGVVAMRERLTQIIGSAAYYVKIHTFHSFCNEVIKDHSDRFISLVDSVSDLEQIEILDRIIDNIDANDAIKPYGNPYFYRADLLSNIKTLKRESISADKLLRVIERLETFLQYFATHISEFTARHARSIKEADCEQFLEYINVAKQDSFYTELINQFWSQSEKISEFKNKVKDFYEKNLKSIPKQRSLAYVYDAYEEALLKSKKYDFEDMILRVAKTLSENKDLLAAYQEQFQYILVDEYQDTNGAQNHILELLTSGVHAENPNIFVVGDDDQSIYRFQGASVENVVAFYRKFQNIAKYIVLKNNYRSVQDILDVSYSVIENNTKRIVNVIPEISKKLTAHLNQTLIESTAECSSDKFIELHQLEKQNEEIFFLTQEIQSLIVKGVSPNSIAVLFRNNKDSSPLVESFMRCQLPFKVDAGNNILEDVEICQLLDLMKVIQNPNNSGLLFNILNYDFLMQRYCFSARDIFEISRLRTQRRAEQMQAEADQLLGLDSSGNAEAVTLIDLLLESEKFSELAAKLLAYKQKSHNMKFDEFFESLIKEFAYLDYILASKQRIEKLNRLNALFDEIKMQVRSIPKVNLSANLDQSSLKSFRLDDFLTYINSLQENSLKLNESLLKTDANAVNLMTAHRSKGLEFDYVFIIKCVDKHWGNKREVSKLKLPAGLIKETESFTAKDDLNEDERRLFYVALTRAKKRLYLSYCAKNDQGRDLTPAIFIEELDKRVLNFHSYQSADSASLASVSQLELLQAAYLEPVDAYQGYIRQEHDFVRDLLKDYKLSVTHLNNYLRCPRLFFYQNLLRVPSAKQKYASFGTAIHNALYDLFLCYRSRSEPLNEQEILQSLGIDAAFAEELAAKQSGDDYELSLLLASFQKHLLREGLSDQEHKDSLEFGNKALREYYAHYQKSFIKKTLLEFDFAHKGLTIEGMPMLGKIDKIEILPGTEDQVNIVDYKTGNPSNKAADMKPGGDYHRQVTFYKLMCDMAHDTKQFPYKVISAELDFIQQDRDSKFIKKQLIISDEDILTLKDEITLFKSKIHELNFEKTDNLAHCEGCAFYNICYKVEQ